MEILSSRTILRPRDPEAALEFYGSTLGLAIAREYPGGTVFFAGQSLIEIAAHGRSDDSDEMFHGALWLQVRDVYDAEAELALKGVRIVRGAKQERGDCASCGSRIPRGSRSSWCRSPRTIPCGATSVDERRYPGTAGGSRAAPVILHTSRAVCSALRSWSESERTGRV